MSLRRFKDYNEKELLDLTASEVEDLISLECAFEGIALKMEEPGSFKDEEMVIPKVTAYRIGEITFLNLELAEKILQIYNQEKIYYATYSDSNYTCKYLEKITPEHYRKPKIEVMEVILPEVWETIKEEQKVLHKKREALKKQKEIYDNWKEEKRQIQEPIWNTLTAIREKEKEKQNCVQLFEKYLEMAKGDFEIAMTFYEKFPKTIKDKEYIQYLTETYGNKIKENNNE